MKKIISTVSTALLLALAMPASVFAHVVVSPAEAAVGSRTTFTVSIPNEKDVAVTALRVAIPSGLESVQPTVQPGWTIATTGSGEAVTEIQWTGGTIPSGQRDEFSFRAKLPANSTELVWKAYQTYADGVTVAWDQKPAEEESEGGTSGPYSVTKVVNDVAATADTTAAPATKDSGSNLLPLGISLVALVISAVALMRRK